MKAQLLKPDRGPVFSLRAEQAAARRLREQYARVFYCLRRMGLPWQEAEDGAQDLFCNLAERGAAGWWPDNEGAWLVRCARNRAVDYYRRRANRRRRERHGINIAERAVNPVPAWDAKLDAADLGNILRNRASFRTVHAWRLVVDEGYTRQEAAKILGITPQAVGVRVEKARQVLRRALEGPR
jgi:RNA polymerase sigma factor (sigma-70 family)